MAAFLVWHGWCCLDGFLFGLMVSCACLVGALSVLAPRTRCISDNPAFPGNGPIWLWWRADAHLRRPEACFHENGITTLTHAIFYYGISRWPWRGYGPPHAGHTRWRPSCKPARAGSGSARTPCERRVRHSLVFGYDSAWLSSKTRSSDRHYQIQIQVTVKEEYQLP